MTKIVFHGLMSFWRKSYYHCLKPYRQEYSLKPTLVFIVLKYTLFHLQGHIFLLQRHIFLLQGHKVCQKTRYFNA